MSLLKDIKLNETQEKEFNERLDSWKTEVENNIKSKYEEEIQKLKEQI